MIDPDDLNVGEWVAVTHHFVDKCRCEFNGRPMQILAVSLPFVACQCGPDEITTVDVRNYGLTKLLPRYVEAVTGLSPKPARRRKPKPEPPDPDRCIRCGNRLHRRLVGSRKEQTRGWAKFCPECGWQGETVPC